MGILLTEFFYLNFVIHMYTRRGTEQMRYPYVQSRAHHMLGHINSRLTFLFAFGLLSLTLDWFIFFPFINC